MVTTRTYKGTIQKKCCRDGVIVYDPPDREFIIKDTIYEEEGEEFEQSLAKWRDKVEDNLEKLADKECKKKGTPKLCHFKTKRVDVTEQKGYRYV